MYVIINMIGCSCTQQREVHIDATTPKKLQLVGPKDLHYPCLVAIKERIALVKRITKEVRLLAL